uniref:SNF-related serine/threonine-protein kinase n=2 Tax=Parascaris univalens TaxID=6257 RepID=A0A915BQA1_PARUN
MSDADRCNSNRLSNDTQCRLMMADPQPVRKSSLSIHDARIAGLYDLEETIGKGHFAVVKLASHVFTGEKVAVKVIDKTKFDATMASHFMQEVRCMKLVQHPNIVRLYEVIDTHTKLFLILELGDYDMYDFIMKNADKGCPENEAQQYFCQIIKAIDYCHKLHVVHRDLKPENVVFFEKLGMVKLTDFGFSNKFTPGEQLATSCGSLAYSAPEILLGDAYDAPAVDVWSLGVILYMLLCGRLPFQEANDSETLTKILDCKYSLPETLSANARNLISRMLVKDASKRATLKEIAENQWVSAGERGLAQVLPLVGRDILPEGAHATIIEQMVAGGVDTEEHILRSLENDDYSYTTATYYLLAERVLSSYREERAREVLARKEPSFNDLLPQTEIIHERGEPSTSVSVGGSAAVARCRSRSNSWRGSTSTARRPCTILKEESEEELSSYLRTSSRQSSRNSSPSVSMFGGMSGSKEKISPQAIQDLLELSRLSVADGRRRAVSPDSRRSSRSPSPPNSSGRSSPAVGVGRMKASLAGGGGMRKLSSSPHLLGICEESEEGEQPSGFEQRHTTTRRSVSSASGPQLSQRIFPAAKAASDVTSSASTTMLTYSKVRMIRPRQAVVSPDMARRYEPHPPHRYPTSRTRRSTSCSSSEASDDDSSERRMNLLVSKCCRCSADDPNNEDDPSKGGGGSLAGAGGEATTNGSTVCHIPGEGDTSVQTAPNSGGSDGTTKCKQRCLALRDTTYPIEDGRHLLSTPLHPIMEIPSTLLSGTLFARSKAAERAVADWACHLLNDGQVASRGEFLKRCVGTPPRYVATNRACERLNCECIRSLRKSCSLPIIALSSDGRHRLSYYESDEDIFSEEELDSSLCWTSTDSGCSSEGETDSSAWQRSLKMLCEKRDYAVVPACEPLLLS